LERQTLAFIKAGMSPDEARRKVKIDPIQALRYE
jgi:hypothetical protein